MAGLRVWAGQSGVLAPWGCVAIAAAPGPLGHLTSTCDVGIKHGYSLANLYWHLLCYIYLFRFSAHFISGLFSVLCPDGHSDVPSSNSSIMQDNNSSFSKYWQLQHTVPFFLIVILFPLCSMKSPTFFTKFNALGEMGISFCESLLLYIYNIYIIYYI